MFATGGPDDIHFELKGCKKQGHIIISPFPLTTIAYYLICFNVCLVSVQHSIHVVMKLFLHLQFAIHKIFNLPADNDPVLGFSLSEYSVIC